MSIVIPLRVAQRAVSAYKVEPRGWRTPCHVSTYSVGSHGYAQVGWHEASGVRRATTAHRAAWTAVHGPIPDGMTVDHQCHVEPCVRVDHLRLLPNLENARRTAGRDWPLGGCIQGHDSTAWRPKGPQRQKGYCSDCRSQRARAG